MKSRNRLCEKKGAMMALVVSAAAMAWAAGEALLANASFEQTDGSWGTWGDSDVRQEYYGVKPQDGKNFARIWSRSGWYQDFPTQKDNRYIVSAFVNTAGKDALRGDAYGEVKVEWRNKSEGDVEVGQSTSVKFDLAGKADSTIAADKWTQITLPEVKAPARATHGRVLVTTYCTDEGKGGGCLLFDNIGITQVIP